MLEFVSVGSSSASTGLRAKTNADSLSVAGSPAHRPTSVLKEVDAANDGAGLAVDQELPVAAWAFDHGYFQAR